MKSYIIRVYEDHYLAREDDSPAGDVPVRYGGLEAAIALAPAKTKRAYPKGTRKRRAKVTEPAAEEV